MSFSLDLEKFAKSTETKLDDVARKVVIGLASSIVLRSPVDTGLFRGNWQYGTTKPLGTTLNIDKSGMGVINNVTHSFTGAEEHYIINNLHYSIKLENGGSKQAPNGMVGQALAEFPFIVKRSL